MSVSTVSVGTEIVDCRGNGVIKGVFKRIN